VPHPQAACCERIIGEPVSGRVVVLAGEGTEVVTKYKDGWKELSNTQDSASAAAELSLLRPKIFAMIEKFDTAPISAAFREFLAMFTLLLEESNRCYAQLTFTDDQFWGRAFVRATFAYIEGVTFALKQTALLAPEGVFSPGELALLREVSFELGPSGEVKDRTAKLQTMPNIRLAFAAFSRSNEIDYQLPVDDHRWAALKDAISIRHRITHPKSSTSLGISKAEVQTVYAAGEWFTDCVKNAFAAASTAGPVE
jgi:hypothetical protein